MSCGGVLLQVQKYKLKCRARNQDNGLRNKQPIGAEHTQLSYLSEKYFHLREGESELVVAFYI